MKDFKPVGTLEAYESLLKVEKYFLENSDNEGLTLIGGMKKCFERVKVSKKKTIYDWLKKK